jgi:YVTN family beta-propeller protein
VRYDLESGDLVNRLSVREGVGALLATPDTIWVVKRDTNLLSSMAPEDDVLRDIASLPGRALNMSYADPAVSVILGEQDTLVRVDSDSGRIRQGTAGDDPTNAVEVGGRVYVVNRNTDTVLLLDPETLQPAGDPIGVGVNPYALVADDRSIWVTNLGDNTLSEIRYR